MNGHEETVPEDKLYEEDAQSLDGTMDASEKDEDELSEWDDDYAGPDMEEEDDTESQKEVEIDGNDGQEDEDDDETVYGKGSVKKEGKGKGPVDVAPNLRPGRSWNAKKNMAGMVA
ncbi:hypothetical protein HDV00_008199 [Rhizophlyctis rosea]|nr:hypothetical protein HDV00_008199 [Rhizophlyctis rosea]